MPHFIYCRKCANDWSVYGFTRKVLALSVFLLIITAMTPLFVPGAESNEALKSRVDDTQDRVKSLEKLPEQFTVLSYKVGQIELNQRDQAAWIRTGVIGVVGTLALKFIEPFGIVLKRKRQEEDE